ITMCTIFVQSIRPTPIYPLFPYTTLFRSDLSGNVTTREVNLRIEVAEAPPDQKHTEGSGAQDLRLFRNGSLVKLWRGDVVKDKRSEEHTSELQSQSNLVCRLLLEKKKKKR